MSVLVSNFQQSLTKFHKPSDGSKVGGTSGIPTDPLFMTLGPNFVTEPASVTEIGFIVSGTNKAGTQYPDGEFYNSFDSDFAGGPVTAVWNFKLLSEPSAVQAFETTLIWTDSDGYSYNGAFQIQYPQGGHVEVSSFNNPWTDTTIVAPLPKDQSSHSLEVDYVFDVVKKNRVVSGFMLDGKSYTIPALFQNAPATKMGWAVKQFVPQFQLDQTQTGGLIVATLDQCMIEVN